MDKLIGLAKSKTGWFGLIVVVLGALQQNADAVTQAVGGDNVGWVMSAIGAGVMFFRWITGSPLEHK